MFDPQRIADDSLAREALAHARTPAAWLGALANAVVPVDALHVADDALAPFRHGVPLADENPLAALGLVVDPERAEPAAAAEDVLQRPRHPRVPSTPPGRVTATTPDRGTHPTFQTQVHERAGSVKASTPGGELLSRVVTVPVAARTGPERIPLTTAAPGPTDSPDQNAAAPGVQHLPPATPRTLPALQLQQLTRVTSPQPTEVRRPGDKSRRPTAHSNEADGPDRPGAATRRTNTALLRDQAAGPGSRFSRPPTEPTPAGQAESTEHRLRAPRWGSVPTEARAPVVPPAPAARSGAAPHAPLDRAGEGVLPPAELANAAAQAGATAVSRGNLPPPLLAALVARQPAVRATDLVRSAGGAENTEPADRQELPTLPRTARDQTAAAVNPSDAILSPHRPGTPPRYAGRPESASSGATSGLEPPPGTPAGASLLDKMLARREIVTASLLPAAEVTREVRPHTAPTNNLSYDSLPLTGPLGVDLLRRTLARFPAAAEPLVPAAADRLSLATGEGASSPSASIPVDMVDSPALPVAPAIQNTFNVTVHMAGAALASEEELAERLTRVLIEQARRNGIDV